MVGNKGLPRARQTWVPVPVPRGPVKSPEGPRLTAMLLEVWGEVRGALHTAARHKWRDEHPLESEREKSPDRPKGVG